MPQHVVPMLHVPDIRPTIAWYVSIGFTLLHQFEEDGEIRWASLAFGNSEIMLNIDGRPSNANRREVDLYIRTDAVDAIHDKLRNRVEIVEELHDTFYGTREFIIRDNNRFWITFGQPR